MNHLNLKYLRYLNYHLSQKYLMFPKFRLYPKDPKILNYLKNLKNLSFR